MNKVNFARKKWCSSCHIALRRTIKGNRKLHNQHTSIKVIFFLHRLLKCHQHYHWHLTRNLFFKDCFVHVTCFGERQMTSTPLRSGMISRKLHPSPPHHCTHLRQSVCSSPCHHPTATYAKPSCNTTAIETGKKRTRNWEKRSNGVWSIRHVPIWIYQQKEGTRCPNRINFG